MLNFGNVFDTREIGQRSSSYNFAVTVVICWIRNGWFKRQLVLHAVIQYDYTQIQDTHGDFITIGHPTKTVAPYIAMKTSPSSSEMARKVR